MELDSMIVGNIRKFNRYYTNLLGVLDKHVFDTGYSLTEARVILEIGFIGSCIANQLVERLDIDRSYMSRIIAKLGKDGLLCKESSPSDHRTSLIRLTPEGTALFDQLNVRSDEQIVRLLQGLTQQEIKEVHAAMMFILNKLDRLERISDDTI